jgi:membrane protein YdbS with pleckstrin-like domain
MAADEIQLLPVEPSYKNVLRVRTAVFGLIVAGLAFVADRVLLAPLGHGGLLAVIGLLVAITLVVTVPQRVYRRLRYGMGERLLQVVRGWLFHTDTVVPLVRVQHLDVVRGPLDKLFGTASLVVHTAGTHNSIVAVPGLAPGRAAEMRDLIREHVSTDPT